MQKRRVKSPPLAEWAAARRLGPGALAGGALEVVKEFPGGMLLGVVHGTGAAEEAATNARSAAALLLRYGKESLTSLVKRCHKQLMTTKGVVLALASFQRGQARMSWLGIGNIEGLLLRAHPQGRLARERLVPFGGVVGYHVAVVKEASLELEVNDTLVFATPGIRSDFDRDLDIQQSPQALAAGILERSFEGADEALVLAARYLGGEP